MQRRLVFYITTGHTINVLQEMKKLIIPLFLALSAAGGLYWILRAPAPSESDVIGVYTGARGGYRDQVQIMPNHRFIQTLKKPNGETITNNGTWTLRNRGLDVGDYSFFINTETNAPLDNPIKYSSFPFTASPKMLIRDWDMDYYKLTKQ